MFRSFIFIFCLFIFSNAYAIFCPNSFKSVNPEDSIDTVTQICGNPTSQKTYQRPKISSQSWIYYVRLQRQSQATSKMKIVFQNNKAINIHLDDNLLGENNPDNANLNTMQMSVTNGRDVSSTTACGSLISLGASTEAVKFSCGDPVNKQINYDPGPGTTITEFNYTGNNNITFIFENGKLKGRK